MSSTEKCVPVERNADYIVPQDYGQYCPTCGYHHVVCSCTTNPTNTGARNGQIVRA